MIIGVPALLEGIPAGLVPAIFLLIIAGLAFSDRLAETFSAPLPQAQMIVYGVGFLVGLMVAGLLLFLPAIVWNKSEDVFYRNFPRTLLNRSSERRPQVFAAAFIGYQLISVPLALVLAHSLMARAGLIATEIILVSIFLAISFKYER